MREMNTALCCSRLDENIKKSYIGEINTLIGMCICLDAVFIDMKSRRGRGKKATPHINNQLKDNYVNC